AAAHQHHGVLLQVVSLTRDVCGDLNPRCQLHTGNLPKRRVRLLRGGGVHACAHTASLRAALESGNSDLARLVAASLADQLLDGWHLPAFCVAVVGRSCEVCSVRCPAVVYRPGHPAAGCVARVPRRSVDDAAPMLTTCEVTRRAGVLAEIHSRAHLVGQARWSTIPGVPAPLQTRRRRPYRRSAPTILVPVTTAFPSRPPVAAPCR